MLSHCKTSLVLKIRVNERGLFSFRITFVLISIFTISYENSNWGWKEKDKREELKEENAR